MLWSTESGEVSEERKRKEEEEAKFLRLFASVGAVPVARTQRNVATPAHKAEKREREKEDIGGGLVSVADRSALAVFALPICHSRPGREHAVA